MENFITILIITGIGLAIWVWEKLYQAEIDARNFEVAEKRLSENAKTISEQNSRIRNLNHQTTNLQHVIHRKDEYYSILSDPVPERYDKLSEFISDFRTLHFDLSAKYLATKKRPAKKEALRIAELKKVHRELIIHNRSVSYKVEQLFALFPELESYFDNPLALETYDNLETLKDNHDRVRDFLSPGEYEDLSEIDRNQLALDRYIERKNKSNWQIGRDYELSVGHEYTAKGWEVEYTGIAKNIADLGRDLITKKGNDVHIIQCKYWAQYKGIHEKHIAQLFGTSKMFELENSDLFSPNVTPVFVTNILLSEMARKFANALGVVLYESREMQEFPRIKCNVGIAEAGKPEKIYHLPMDQQYDRTQLKKTTDFFTFTVEEAVENGFRRAHRWQGDLRNS